MIFGIIFLFRFAFAYEVGKGLELCWDIQNYINILVDYTTTKCIPSRAEKKDVVSFILISEKPVFSSEDAKKAWLLVVVGAVGKVMNDRPNIEGDEVIVSDVNLTRQYRYYSFPVNLAKNLQGQLYRNEISLDRCYTDLTRKMNFKKIEPKK